MQWHSGAALREAIAAGLGQFRIDVKGEMKGKVVQKAAAPEIDTMSTITLPKEIQTVTLTSRMDERNARSSLDYSLQPLVSS